jgi:ArsR family transcriptional regulator
MARETLDCILTALADPIRRRALALLHSRDELCVCELMSALGVTQSRMSRHMSTLKAAGLVLDRRDAQWVRYRGRRWRHPGHAWNAEIKGASQPAEHVA